MRRVLAFFILTCMPAIAGRQFQVGSDTLTATLGALPPNGTVSVWVNPQFAPGQGNFHVFFQQYDLVTGSYFQLMTNSQDMLYAAWNNRGTVTNAIAFPGSYTLNRNAWNHLAATWSSGNFITVYLNGAQIATAGSCPWISLPSVLGTFGNSVTPGPHAQSIVAEYGFWSRVLTASELLLLKAGNPPSAIPSGLFAEYDLAGASLAAQAGAGGTLVSSGTVVAGDPPPPPVPTLSLSGPASGTIGAPSGFFSVAEAHLSKTTTVTPSDAGAGGTFTPPAVILTGASATAAFTYTPVRLGALSIAITTDQNIPNPPAVAFGSVAAVAIPTITLDATNKTVAHGTDASFTLTQAALNGYPGGIPSLFLFNAPASLNFSVNGTDCGASGKTVRFFSWQSCGVAASGTYHLTVHTTSLASGTYVFQVSGSEPRTPAGFGVTLILTVQ